MTGPSRQARPASAPCGTVPPGPCHRGGGSTASPVQAHELLVGLGVGGRELVRRDAVEQQLLRRRLACHLLVDVPGLGRAPGARTSRSSCTPPGSVKSVPSSMRSLERLPRAVVAEARPPAHRDADQVVGQRQVARPLVAEIVVRRRPPSPSLSLTRHAPGDGDRRVGRDRAQRGVGGRGSPAAAPPAGSVRSARPPSAPAPRPRRPRLGRTARRASAAGAASPPRWRRRCASGDDAVARAAGRELARTGRRAARSRRAGTTASPAGSRRSARREPAPRRRRGTPSAR